MIREFRHRFSENVNQRFFFGWVIVGVTSLGIFTSGPGQSHTFSVFVAPISQELGISNREWAIAYGLATLIASLLLPRMGKIIDKFGPRISLIYIVLLLGLSCFFFGAAAHYYMLAMGFGFLRFFGQGSLMLGCANLVSQWFDTKRGLAMSLMALGFGISMAVHPPLAHYLIDNFGWRAAWFILGGLSWVLMVPPIILLVFDKPEDLNLRVDGAPKAKNLQDETLKEEEIKGLDLRAALRERAFYILAFGWFGMAMLITTLHVYQVIILTAHGHSAQFSAQIFVVSAITMVLFMPVIGRMFDRFPTHYVIALGMVVTASSLLSITFAITTSLALFYAVIFGLNNAISMTMFGYIWPKYFGRRFVGSIQGAGQMVGVFGASCGPLPVAIALDLFGSSSEVIRLLAIYPTITAIICILFLRVPKKLVRQV